MNKKTISLYLLLITLSTCEFSYLGASEVAEGFLGGGLFGSAIGGAAGGGRGAAIGGAVGAGVGAMTGAAVRESRKRRYHENYYEDSEMLLEQNEELSYENKRKNSLLIYRHRRLIQYYERYNWMLDQCRAGKTGYRREAKQLEFDDDTNYSKFRRWRNKKSVRSQKRLLIIANDQLKHRIEKLKNKTRNLKTELYKCEGVTEAG